MQRFLVSLVCIMLVNAANSAYLPVVDVSNGSVSARAAFGEEIAPVSQQKTENVAKALPKVERKVVSRSAKKTLSNDSLASADVLRPNRPRSNLWTRGEEPLRMPRMDEIAVLDSDDILPEENLDSGTVRIARNNDEFVTQRETLDELKQLRAEIARLSDLQKKSVVRARPLPVATPVTGESKVKPATERKLVESDSVNVQRAVVPMESEKEIARRAIVKNTAEPKITVVKEMNKMSPNELKKAFKKTYLSENKHLSTYENENGFDVISDMSAYAEGFNAARDLSEMDSGVRPMEIKISFLNGDAGISRENYNLLSETASIVVNNPKRAIQIAIPETSTHAKDSRRLAARRLAIVEQVLRDTGVAEQRIIPVLSQRDGDEFVLRVISGDTFESLTRQKRNMFGDSVSKKTYKNMTW